MHSHLPDSASATLDHAAAPGGAPKRLPTILDDLADQIGLAELEPIVEQFAVDVGESLGHLRHAQASSDVALSQRMRHRLKGLLLQLGAAEALDHLAALPESPDAWRRDELAAVEDSAAAVIASARRLVAGPGGSLQT